MNTIKIAPSILSADFSCLADEIKRVEEAGADLIHIDVMDGHFVPNLTFGPPVVAAIRKVTKLPFDVHLMITNPEEFITPFAKAGADILTVHAETTHHLHKALQEIHGLGMKAGVSLNPATPLTLIEEVLEDIDMILIMTVNPGFGGQSFIPSTLHKIKRLRAMLNEQKLSTNIEVDGGITTQNAVEAIQAGATILVAGSAIYSAQDMKETVQLLKGC
ncbi:ribulose-phosphate 3-epimerase [Sporomusaceae bacterium BoRhaA]|uniref:ribulose-phosphate 3-epimerase n=1 Tax=Pelorhabdus rhamnosifermentans TaxID=2772457 RepID=UPI001C063A25|nr:ribulose-phosphate 3-epimerase [Pelorhabdus rhamnosifermentans]MBU2700259.1 ribulose-phosphate 3-epimerase [Pelorhabdus rhamnosifermentans]